MTVKEQHNIVRCIHDRGHLGRDKVISQVSSRYYWKTLYSDVTNFVSGQLAILITMYIIINTSLFQDTLVMPVNV